MAKTRKDAADRMAAVHPSSLLRAPDEETRHRETKRFIDDLRKARRALKL